MTETEAELRERMHASDPVYWTHDRITRAQAGLRSGRAALQRNTEYKHRTRRLDAIAAIELLELTWRGRSSAYWRGGVLVETNEPIAVTNSQRYGALTRTVVERRMAGQGWLEINRDALTRTTEEARHIFADHVAALQSKLPERPKWIKKPEAPNDSLLHYKGKLVAWVGTVRLKPGFYVLTNAQTITHLASLGVAKDIATVLFLRDELDRRAIAWNYLD